MEPNYEDALAEDSLFLLDLCPKQAFPRCSPEDNLAQKWLEHLCTYEVEDLNDRRIRNIYISHLCTALVKGKLYGPFLKEPPCGKLDKVDFTTQAPCSSVNAAMLPQQRMQYRPPRPPCPGSGTCHPSCQAPCSRQATCVPPVTSQSAATPAPCAPYQTPSSPCPTPPAPFPAPCTPGPSPSAPYQTPSSPCPTPPAPFPAPCTPAPSPSAPCPTPPGPCPTPSAPCPTPPGPCPTQSAPCPTPPGPCPTPSAQYSTPPGPCPTPSAPYSTPPGPCPTQPAPCPPPSTPPCTCPQQRSRTPSPCPSQYQPCPPAVQASNITMGATSSQPSMSQPSVATLGAARSGVPSQGQISACSNAPQSNSPPCGGAGSHPLCTCPPAACQCAARGQPCNCGRSRAGAEKKAVDDEEIICNYLMQQLNFTPDFLTSFDATLTSFMDLCKGASLECKTKPQPQSTSEYSLECAKQHYLPNCESSTIETNVSTTTQDTRSSSPTNDIDDMRDDINKLLAAIMAELSGDVEPGSNDYLDRELARYKGFLMANSRLTTNFKNLKCDMKLRNCLLLSLQNDLVKLLNEHNNNNK